MSLRRIVVAAAGTHHELDGTPLYAERFDEVLKYHEPGLAAVRRGGAAWHIDLQGRPAYPACYLRTFGFYEGLAAVTDQTGWFHIDTEGRARYEARYRFCGNFQEGRCPVRDGAGRAWHIDAQGRAAYEARYRYAGDYRDGGAVVQGEDGRSTHIDPEGRQLHGRWFLDLDVFHKGFARARDEVGWHHVDRWGQPLYARRFSGVEPFYNGMARVEREDGALEIIDESGATVTSLRPPLRSPLHALSADLVGAWRTDAIAAAVRCGVFDALPGAAPELGATLGLSAPRVARLLRALGELGLVQRNGTRWTLTPRGRVLRRDHEESLADAALEYAGPLRAAWADLAARLRDPWPRSPTIFLDVARDAGRRRPHHRMLESYARHDYAGLVPLLPLGPRRHVIDAGGGTGALAALVAGHFPHLRVTVLELPEIAAMLAAPGEGRVSAQPADLLAPWPVRGDAVLLARVLHDWDDDGALQILRRAREALPVGGGLCVLELVLDEVGYEGGLCDLHLLATTGGRERTEAEFAALFAGAGFRYQGLQRGAALPSVLLGVAS